MGADRDAQCGACADVGGRGEPCDECHLAGPRGGKWVLLKTHGPMSYFEQLWIRACERAVDREFEVAMVDPNVVGHRVVEFVIYDEASRISKAMLPLLKTSLETPERYWLSSKVQRPDHWKAMHVGEFKIDLDELLEDAKHDPLKTRNPPMDPRLRRRHRHRGRYRN